jgi:hypothetical protein
MRKKLAYALVLAFLPIVLLGCFHSSTNPPASVHDSANGARAGTKDINPSADEKIGLIDFYSCPEATYRQQAKQEPYSGALGEFLNSVSETNDGSPWADADLSFRFIWYPVLNGNPLVIVLSKKGQEYRLYSKTGTMDETGKAFKLLKRQDFAITRDDWYSFVTLSVDTDYWSLSPTDPNRVIFDGAYWALESRCQKQYHSVGRASPDSRSGFRVLCDQLLKMAKETGQY